MDPKQLWLRADSTAMPWRLWTWNKARSIPKPWFVKAGLDLRSIRPKEKFGWRVVGMAMFIVST
jgi:hypothetical protein